MDDFLLAETIVRVVARAGGVKVQVLRGRRVHSTLNKLRDTARYLIRQKTGLSFAEIGKLFGGQNHASVMSAVAREKLRLERRAVHASGIAWEDWHKHVLALVDQDLVEAAAEAVAPKEEA